MVHSQSLEKLSCLQVKVRIVNNDDNPQIFSKVSRKLEPYCAQQQNIENNKKLSKAAVHFKHLLKPSVFLIRKKYIPFLIISFFTSIYL